MLVLELTSQLPNLSLTEVWLLKDKTSKSPPTHSPRQNQIQPQPPRLTVDDIGLLRALYDRQASTFCLASSRFAIVHPRPAVFVARGPKDRPSIGAYGNALTLRRLSWLRTTRVALSGLRATCVALGTGFGGGFLVVDETVPAGTQAEAAKLSTWKKTTLQSECRMGSTLGQTLGHKTGRS